MKLKMENTKSKMLGRSNDLISDSIIRIKNGYSRRLDQVSLYRSKEILQLLEALLQGGYIQNYTVDQKSINVLLKYYQSLPAIKGVQRLSKPNKRLYFSKKNIIKVSQEQNWGEN